MSKCFDALRFVFCLLLPAAVLLSCKVDEVILEAVFTPPEPLAVDEVAGVSFRFTAFESEQAEDVEDGVIVLQVPDNWQVVGGGLVWPESTTMEFMPMMAASDEHYPAPQAGMQRVVFRNTYSDGQRRIPDHGVLYVIPDGVTTDGQNIKAVYGRGDENSFTPISPAPVIDNSFAQVPLPVDVASQDISYSGEVALTPDLKLEVAEVTQSFKDYVEFSLRPEAGDIAGADQYGYRVFITANDDLEAASHLPAAPLPVQDRFVAMRGTVTDNPHMDTRFDAGELTATDVYFVDVPAPYVNNVDVMLSGLDAGRRYRFAGVPLFARNIASPPTTYDFALDDSAYLDVTAHQLQGDIIPDGLDFTSGALIFRSAITGAERAAIIMEDGEGNYTYTIALSAGHPYSVLWLSGDGVARRTRQVEVLSGAHGESGSLAVELMDEELYGPPPPVPDTVLLHGRVTDGGDPLTDFRVYSELVTCYEPLCGGEREMTYTDEEGLFSLELKPAGTYIVGVGDHPECEGEGCFVYPWIFFDEGQPYQPDLFQATYIRVDAEGNVSMSSDAPVANPVTMERDNYEPVDTLPFAEIAFPELVEIRARVAAPNGELLDNIVLGAVPAEEIDHNPAVRHFNEDVPGEPDAHRFRLAYGVYRLAVFGPTCIGDGCDSLPQRDFYFAGEDIDWDGHISGSEVSLTEDPAQASLFHVWPEGVELETGTGGWNGFLDPEVVIDFNVARLGAEPTHEDLTPVRGRVMDQGEPALAQVWATPAGCTGVLCDGEQMETVTGTNGDFTLHLPPGTYRIGSSNGPGEYPVAYFNMDRAYSPDHSLATLVRVHEDGAIALAPFDEADGNISDDRDNYAPIGSTELLIAYPALTELSGATAPGVLVAAEPILDEATGEYQGSTGRWLTNDDGDFKLILEQGRYRLLAGGQQLTQCAPGPCQIGGRYPYGYYAGQDINNNGVIDLDEHAYEPRRGQASTVIIGEAGVTVLPAGAGAPLPLVGSTRLDIPFPELFQLSGTVRDRNGRPLPGLDVHAERECAVLGECEVIPPLPEQTDADGRYTLLATEGTYRIAAGGAIWDCDDSGCTEGDTYPFIYYADDHAASVWDQATALTVSGAGISGLDMRYGSGAVGGRLVDDKGEGLRSVTVSFYSNSGAGRVMTATDAEGYFSLSRIPAADDYRLEIFHNDLRPVYRGLADGSGCLEDCFTANRDRATTFVIDGHDLDLGNIVLAEAVKRTISGVITGALVGNTPQSVRISAWSESEYTSGNKTVMADSEGKVAFSVQLPEGPDYRVSIVPEWDSGLVGGLYREAGEQDELTEDQARATRLDLTAGDYDDIDIALTTGKRIAGTVTLVTPPGSEPDLNPYVWVIIESESKMVYKSARAWYLDTVDGNARYEYERTGLKAAADYRLSAQAEGAGGFYPRVYYSGADDGGADNQSSSWDAATLLDLSTRDQLQGVDLELGGGNSIAGTLTVTGAGESLRNQTVYTWLSAWSHGLSASSGIYVDVAIDANGDGSLNYQLPLEPAADWELDIQLPGLTADLPGLLDNTGGKLENVDITLSSGRSVSGQVMQDGAGVPDVMVHAVHRDPVTGASDGGWAWTDADGGFALEGLAPLDGWELIATTMGGLTETATVNTTGGDISGATIELPSRFSLTTVSGRVCEFGDGFEDFTCSAGSTPVSGGWISASDGQGGFAGTVIGSAGAYSLDLEDGEWSLSIQADGLPMTEVRVRVADGDIVTDFAGANEPAAPATDVELATGASIFGRVNGGTGNMLSGCVAVYRDEDGNGLDDGDSFQSCEPVNGSGGYRTATLVPGDYILVPLFRGYPGAEPSDPVPITDRDQEVRLDLPDTSGTISIGGTVNVGAGYVRVVVGAFRDGALVDSVTLDDPGPADGQAFSITDLPEGSYEVRVMGYERSTVNGITREGVTASASGGSVSDTVDDLLLAL